MRSRSTMFRQTAPARHTALRRGVTLLEVMFAIGVVVVGLLGVLVMLPLGGYHVSRALTADRVGRIGQNAEHELRTRGYTSQAMWVRWYDNTSYWGNLNGPSFGPICVEWGPDQTWGTADDLLGAWSPGRTWLPGGAAWGGGRTNNVWDAGYATGGAIHDDILGPPQREAYCIDPEFIAQNSAAFVGQTPAQYFPHYLPGWNITKTTGPYTLAEQLQFVRLRRITLRAGPGVNLPMTQALASYMFTDADDLSIERPKDLSLLPQQIYTNGPGPDGQWGRAGVDDDGDGTVDNGSEAGWPGSDDVNAKRQYQGEYKWFVTLVPKLDAPSGQDLFTMSVVVFRNRVLDISVSNPTEQIAEVSFLGGSEARLFAVSQPGLDPNFKHLKLREGDWILLSASAPTAHTTGPGPIAVVPRATFSWFKVLRTDSEAVAWLPGTDGQWGNAGVDDNFDGTVDDILEAGAPGSDDIVAPNTNPPPAGASPYSRAVTLQGRDWLPAVVPGFRTQATIVDGVVGVFEKTVRLESSSLWAN